MSQMKPIVDELLSKSSSIYVPDGFICEQVLPMIESKNSTGKLAKYGNSHLRIENSLKGGRGSYRRVETITRSTDSFSIEGHGLEGMVSADDYKNTQLPFKAEEDETLGLTTMLYLEKEKLLADTLTSTSILTQNTTLSGTSQLSDYTDSDPVSVFKTARSTVRNGSGMAPNMAVMDWNVAEVLRYHPKLLDLGFKYLSKGGLTNEGLAIALGVQQILIANVMYNSAKENQTDSLAAVWGKHIVFAYAPAKAQPYQVSLGYRVQFESEMPRKVYKQANFNPPGSSLVLVEDSYDMLISNAGAGYLVKDAIA
jgi:hypothetical protein